MSLQVTGLESSRRGPSLDSTDGIQHELPELAPLSHSHPQLSSSQPFVVDAFLLSRSHMSLQDLRTEFRAYSAQLKEELVQLINDDYTAFISLSTDLKGEGVRLERLHAPLLDLRAKVEISRDELLGVQDAVKMKLAERTSLREEKALLHLLLKLSDSVARLESLLLIAHKDQNASQTSVDLSGLGLRSMNGLALQTADEDPKDDRTRGGQAKHLARVALEYTQLLYHAAKARNQKCVFADEIQWRIDRIKTTLSRDLDHLFTNTLNSLTSSTIEVASVTDKARWTSDLTECLRTYDILELWEDAEDVVRRELVQPFVKNNIFAGALNVAPSPILVRTQMPGRAPLLSPNTPYTPFAGVRANPFDTLAVESIPLLAEEDDEPLAGLYNTILRFVQVNCIGVIELSDKISTKSRRGARKLGPSGSALQSPVIHQEPPNDLSNSTSGFEMMANVVWAEVARAVMDDLGAVVFSAGNPDEFQKNYTRSNRFITALEHLTPSLHAVEAMRGHPTYATFQRRWQLPVYFQMRWKEIVGKLEESLANPVLHVQSKVDDFVTSQASAFFTTIQSCWTTHVYIPELSHRFWRLTLQILSRYKRWLDSNLPAREHSASAAEAPTSSSVQNAPMRSSTPVKQPEGVESSATDEMNLQRLAAAFIDISAMEKRVWDLWTTEMGVLLSSATIDEDNARPEDVLRQSIDALTALLPDVGSQIVVILTRRCLEALAPVKSIPSQYRAMSKKRDPIGPSFFISNILQPVRRFFESDGLTTFLKETDRKAWATQVCNGVIVRYIAQIEAIKKNEESLRRHQKGKLPASSWFGTGPSRENDAEKDEERIKMQFVLDVEAFAQDASQLGVDVPASQPFSALQTTAAS